MASAHRDGGDGGEEAQQAGESAVLEGEMHGSGEVEDGQEEGGHEVGLAATEAYEPRATLIDDVLASHARLGPWTNVVRCLLRLPPVVAAHFSSSFTI